METSINFGELSKDENFKNKIIDLRKNIDESSKVLDSFLSLANYEELSLEDKVR